MQDSLLVIVVISTAIGICLGFLLARTMMKGVKNQHQRNQQKKLEWDAQDARLLATVQSDHEKQLEAKIATLEAALKQALKKN